MVVPPATVTLSVKLELRLFRAGSPVETATAETAGVTVDLTSESVSVTASVGGSGGITVHTATP